MLIFYGEFVEADKSGSVDSFILLISLDNKNMEKILFENVWIIIVALLWTVPWKAAALWRSARRAQMGWFLTMLIINTLGILEILYIFFFSRREVPSQTENIQNFRTSAKFEKDKLAEKVNKRIIM